MRLLGNKLAAIAIATAAVSLAGAAEAQRLALTSIHVSGPGVIADASGPDAPSIGATVFINADVTFFGPPYFYQDDPDGMFFTNGSPGDLGYSLNFSQTVSDGIYSQPADARFADGFSWNPDGLFFVIRTLDPDFQAQLNIVCCVLDGSFFYGDFDTPEGENIYGGNWTPETVTLTFAEVPEPIAWSFLILGFSAMGVMLRRSRRLRGRSRPGSTLDLAGAGART